MRVSYLTRQGCLQGLDCFSRGTPILPFDAVLMHFFLPRGHAWKKYKNSEIFHVHFILWLYVFVEVPQSVFALMESSRYRPSSLDLLHFVVRSHCGQCSTSSGQLATRNASWQPWICKRMKMIRMKIRSAQNVRKVLISRLVETILTLFKTISFFLWARQIKQLCFVSFFSLVVQWLLFT